MAAVKGIIVGVIFGVLGMTFVNFANAQVYRVNFQPAMRHYRYKPLGSMIDTLGREDDFIQYHDLLNDDWLHRIHSIHSPMPWNILPRVTTQVSYHGCQPQFKLEQLENEQHYKHGEYVNEMRNKAARAEYLREQEEIQNQHEAEEWSRRAEERQQYEEEILRKKQLEQQRIKQQEAERQLLRQQYEEKQSSQRLHKERIARLQEYQHRQQQEANNMIELAKHKVHGYDPVDIKISIEGDRIKISGNHVCSCTEECITREFTRAYPFDDHIVPETITVSLDAEGMIRVKGEMGYYHGSQLENLNIPVKGIGIPERTVSESDLRQCLTKKGGIKLKKVNRDTRKDYVQEEYLYEHEVLRGPASIDNDDDASIEVEY